MAAMVGLLLWSAGPGFRMLLRSEFEQSLPLSLTSIQSASVSLQGMIEAKELVLQGPDRQDHGGEAPLVAQAVIDPRSSSAFAAGIVAKTTLRRSSRFPWHSPRRSEESETCMTSHPNPKRLHEVDWFPNGLLGRSPGEVWNEFQRSAPIAIDVRNTKDRWNAAIVPLQISLDETEKRVRALRSLSLDATNPLRDREVLEQKMEETKELALQMQRLQMQVQQAETQFQSDRSESMQRLEKEVDTLANKRVISSLDARAIARSILIEMSRSTLSRVHNHVDILSGKSILSQREQPASTRGDDSALDRFAEKSRVQFKAIQWDGDVTIDAQSFDLQGTAHGLASQPDKADVPARMTSIAKSPSTEMRFSGAKMHPNEEGWDTYEFASSKYGFTDWRLCNRQGLRIVGKGAPVQVHVRSFLSDGQNRTEIHMEQPELQLRVECLDTYAGTRLAQQFSAALQTISHLKLVAEVEGDPSNETHWRVECNLEGMLEDGLREALKSEIAFLRQELRSQFIAEFNSMLAPVESDLSQRKSELLFASRRLMGEIEAMNEVLLAKRDGPSNKRYARLSDGGTIR